MRATCDGLVIRETDYGDSDKLLTVLTAEYGQMTVIAKGARSSKSKVMPLCRLFTYANLEYYEKNGRRWLSGGSVNDSFFGISADIRGFALASYVVQLAAEITGEGVEAESVLRMTLNTLYAIEKQLKPYAQIKSVYEISAISEAGFAPDLDGCGECGATESEKGFWLDVMNGRLLCDECMSARGNTASLPTAEELHVSNILVPIEERAVAAWKYVVGASPKRVLAFELKDEDLKSLSHATETYVVNHLERGFETLEFYNTVKE